MIRRAIRRLRRDPAFSIIAVTATGLAAGVVSVLVGIERAARPPILLPAVDRLVVFHTSSSAGSMPRLSTAQWQVIRDLPFLDNAFAYSIWPVTTKDRELNVVLLDTRALRAIAPGLTELTSHRLALSSLLPVPADHSLELNSWKPELSAQPAPPLFPLEPWRPIHAWSTLDTLPALEQSARFNDPNSSTSWLTVAAWLKEGVAASAAADGATQSLQAAGSLSLDRRIQVVSAQAWESPNAAVPRPLLHIVRAMGLLVVISLAATVCLIGLMRTIRDSGTYSTEVTLGAELRHLALPRTIDWLFVAAGGAVLALLVSPLLRSLLLAAVPAATSIVPRNEGARAVGFGFLTATVVTLPALCYGLLVMRSERLQSAANSYSHTARSTRRLFGLVLFAQFALAAVLITATVVLGRTLSSAQQVDPGFTRTGAVVAAIRVAKDSNSLPYEAVLNALRSDPAIQHVSILTAVPLGETSQVTTITPDAGKGSKVRSFMAQAGPDIVKALGATLIAGRDFDHTDLGKQTGAAIVNESLARRLAGGVGPAVGTGITVRQERFTIVGVVSDGKYVQLTEAPSPFVYVTYHGDPTPANLVVRGQSAAIAPLEGTLRNYFDRPGWPILGRTIALATLVDKWLGPISSVLQATRWLAPLVILMAFYGVLSVAAVVLASGRRDLAIREAVGATHRQAMRQHVWPYCRLAIGGGVFGLFVAAALGKVGSAMLFGVNSFDAGLLGITAAAILLTVICAVALAMVAYRNLPLTLALELRQ